MSEPTPGLIERWRARRAADPVGWRARSVLWFLLVVLVGYLAFGDNPWEDGLAKRIREGKNFRGHDYWITNGYWVVAVEVVVPVGVGVDVLVGVGVWVGVGVGVIVTCELA